MSMSVQEMLFVVLLGMGTVFLGLICIVILCKIVGAICVKSVKEKEVSTPVAKTSVPQKIENRQEIVAAVSAVIAEELGKDISAIRILSFKKI